MARVSRRETLGRMLAVSAGALPPLLGAGCSADGGAGGAGDGADGGDGGRGREPGTAPGFDGRSPLTGEPVDGPAPVLAATIDNVAASRPHRGVEAADVVYVAPVEAGPSCLLAVFSSRLPRRLGPIRGARESDIAVLRQFGRPAVAYSGADEVVDRLLVDAPLALLCPERVDGGYERDPDRSAPHDLYARPRTLLSGDRSAGVSTAADIGFRFGSLPERPGRPVGTVPAAERTVAYDAFELEVRADRGRGRWQLVMDGRPYAAGPSTVVVQRVGTRASAYDPIRRSGAPYVETVGAGEATVFRAGQVYAARWSRPTPADGTTFRGADGNVIDFTPGQVWIIYDAS